MTRLLSTRRLSKFKRKDEERVITVQDILKKPVLTQRDKAVLMSIYYHRCLTTEQLTEIHFRYRKDGTENQQAALITRRRVRKLFDYRLIDRFFIDVGENNGSSPGHLLLDQLGANIVAGLLNCKMEDLNWRYEMNNVRLPYLQHMVEVNNFYVWLLQQSRKQKGHEILNFRTENLTRFDFKHWGQKFTFNPDAYGQYFYGEDGFHFFLELDRDTMTPGSFQRKQQRYATFYDSSEYTKYFATFPIVLVVTPSLERAKVLQKVIYATSKTDIRWLFTSRDLAEKDPLAAIWLGEKEKPESLVF